MNDEDKVFCASCGEWLINQLAVQLQGIHLYEEEGHSHDWTTVQSLTPFADYSAYLCLDCANEAMEEITGACD